MMISDLNDSGQHLRGHPARRGPVRFASVAVLEEGGYKIVRRDTTRKEHQVTTSTSINGIARDLTI
jgi:hypothetical protein